MANQAAVQIQDLDGAVYFVSLKKAKQLRRDKLAVVVGTRPLRLMQTSLIRRMFTAKYLHGSTAGLRVYRDDLRDTLIRERTGKPGNVDDPTYVELQKAKSERHVRTPHGWGREN